MRRIIINMPLCENHVIGVYMSKNAPETKDLLAIRLERAAKQFPEFTPEAVIAMVDQQRESLLSGRIAEIPKGVSVGKIVTGEVVRPKP